MQREVVRRQRRRLLLATELVSRPQTETHNTRAGGELEGFARTHHFFILISLVFLTPEPCRRLDFSKKWVLDILRGAAHNARRQALNTWMTVYSDWRDHTQRFRDFLNLGGVVSTQGQHPSRHAQDHAAAALPGSR